MAKKLLIVGGDSLSDPNYFYYQARMKGQIKMWWETLAEQNNWDVINLSETAACSDYTANKVIDTIVENNDREMIVTTVWSRGYRDAFADTLHLILEYGKKGWHESETAFMDHVATELKNNENDLTIDEFVTNIYFKSLRAIWKLNDFCKSKGIPFYHAQGGWTFLKRDLLKIQLEERGILDMSQNDFMTQFINHPYYTDLAWEPNFAGWDYSLAIDVILKGKSIGRNPHPTQGGQTYMARVMQNLIDGKRPEPNIEDYKASEKIS